MSKAVLWALPQSNHVRGLRPIRHGGVEAAGTGFAEEPGGVEDQISKTGFPGPLDINEH